MRSIHTRTNMHTRTHIAFAHTSYVAPLMHLIGGPVNISPQSGRHVAGKQHVPGRMGYFCA